MFMANKVILSCDVLCRAVPAQLVKVEAGHLVSTSLRASPILIRDGICRSLLYDYGMYAAKNYMLLDIHNKWLD